MLKKLIHFLRDIAFIIFLLALCFMIHVMKTGQRFTVNGYQVLRVLTSSMEPVIAENTCIIIRSVDPAKLKEGDIITFVSEDPDILGYLNTHRIYAVHRENGKPLFETKGDAIAEPDRYLVHADEVVGIFVRELPYGREIGKAFVALSDNKVYFFVVILPLCICMLSYFWQIVGLITNADDEEDEETVESDGTEAETGEKSGETGGN